MQAVRLLLIGAGVIGRTHIDRIGRDPHLALAGIADPSEAGKALAERLGVPWAASHVELLEHTQPQGAIVATPNASHVGMAIDCLERGVAALVEKPVADTVTEAQKQKMAADEQQRKNANTQILMLDPRDPQYAQKKAEAAAGRAKGLGSHPAHSTF